MRTALLLAALVAGLVSHRGHAEVEVALSGGFAYGAVMYLADIGESPDSIPVFVGADVAVPLAFGDGESTALGVEVGFLYWPGGNVLIGHTDLAFGRRHGIIRPSIAAGLSFCQYTSGAFTFDEWRLQSWGPDLRARVRLVFGSVSVGMGLSVPIDLLMRFALHDWPVLHDVQDELRIFTAQCTIAIGCLF